MYQLKKLAADTNNYSSYLSLSPYNQYQCRTPRREDSICKLLGQAHHMFSRFMNPRIYDVFHENFFLFCLISQKKTLKPKHTADHDCHHKNLALSTETVY